MAKWIYSKIKPFNLKAENAILFRLACRNGNGYLMK